MSKELNLKDEVVRMARDILAEIPYNNIYAYADNLFDKPEMELDDPDLEPQVTFLKNTRLKDCQFLSTDSEEKLILRNLNTNKTIHVSNRESSRGEIRGKILEKIVKDQKVEDSSQDLFEVITKAVKNPDKSDAITMFRGVVVGDNAKKVFNGESMDLRHFTFFTHLAVKSIEKKIKNKEIEENTNPKEIRTSELVKDHIWKGIDLNAIYDVTGSFEKNIRELEQKALNLRKRGYITSSALVTRLINDIESQKHNFFEGEQDLTQFSTNCNSLLDNAKNSDLSKLRGVGKLINSLVNVLISIATLGVANIVTGRLNVVQQTTNSIEKVNKMKASLHELTKTHQDEESNEEQDGAARPA